MNSKEYFNLFYIDGTDGIFRVNKTANKIPQFISHTIITDKEIRKKLPDEFNFHTWLKDGKGSPLRLWGEFARYYNEEVFSKALFNEIDDFHLEELCERVGVPTSTSKDILCIALAKQFEAIILGKGVAEDIIADVVAEAIIYSRFTPYIVAASRRYNVMKLINEDEAPLDQLYVCNTIGEKERVFDDLFPIKGEKILDPDVHQIRNIFNKKGFDNLRTLLVGSGGCGKSLMLQYIFLKSATEYKKTGVLPIFVELRNLTQETDLIDCIVDIVKNTVSDFGKKEAKQIFAEGNCQLFLDGLDEIDPTDMPSFLKKLKKFTEKYNMVQIIVTSRTKSLSGFTKLYVWPFDEKKSLELINKVLKYKKQEANKDVVVEYLYNGFLKKNGIFAVHPLLLTFVALNFPQYKKYNDNPLQFYKQTYLALLSGHDNNKKPYDRVFMSVDDAIQFSKVFREFCAITYRDAVFWFDETTFEDYCNQITVHKEFENPKKMNHENFRHDVCSTACIMYDKDSDLYYIDPVFQKFLFAEYYAQAPEDTTKELIKYLSKNSANKYKDFEALDLLYKQNEEKVKVCLIRPYLDMIFKSGSEAEKFSQFIIHGFDEIYYSVLNTNVSDSYNIQTTLWMLSITEPYNILFTFILKMLGINRTFSHTYSGPEVFVPENVSSVFLGRKTQYEDIIEIASVSQTELELPSFRETHDINDYVESDDDYLVFGHEYVIQSYNLYSEPEKYKDALSILMTDKCEFYMAFQRLKEYYEILKKEQFRNNIESNMQR